MTKISEVSSTNNNISYASGSMDVQYDAETKNLESKIMDAQKRQKGLNSDRDMTAEERSSARQEIQREISELRRQLRQRQAEQKKEQQKDDKTAEERKERLKSENTDDTKGVIYEGRSADSLKDEREEDNQKDAPVTKEAAMKQIRMVVNADTKIDGKIRVIEAEEKQDSIGKTGNIDKKSRLDDVRKRSQRVEIAQKAMFGEKDKKSDKNVGSMKRFYDDDRYKGLYNNKGMMIPNAIVS